MENTTIELKNVWKTYKMGEMEVHALKGLNLKVKRGSFSQSKGLADLVKALL